jgi:hypothetical protein
MRSHPVRFSKLRTLVAVFAVLAILGGAGVVGLGIHTGIRDGLVQSNGGPLVAAGLALIVLAIATIALTWLLVKIESHTNRQYNQLIDLCDLIKNQANVLSSIAHSSRVSESIKSITGREEEREAMRAAIREDVAREDWEAALYLVDQIEHRFGYQEEADALRRQIIEERTAHMRNRLNEALGRIERHWEAFEWDRAAQEIQRLLRALPDDKHTRRLPEEQQRRRESRKQDLLAAWKEAVRPTTGQEEDMDVDGAIRILHELDPYLTRDEARALEESARGVFRAKLAQFGLQFELAVKDQRWREALEVGVQIMEEYPNSKMAAQVREMEGVLRQRAGLTGDVEVTVQPGRSSDN